MGRTRFYVRVVRKSLVFLCGGSCDFAPEDLLGRRQMLTLVLCGEMVYLFNVRICGHAGREGGE